MHVANEVSSVWALCCHAYLHGMHMLVSAKHLQPWRFRSGGACPVLMHMYNSRKIPCAVARLCGLMPLVSVGE